ncbi:MAG: cytochrome D ubiquinol oxidase subunit II, partial [Synechococcales cyanobacterium CRU_2_2]|nr:cytochrome D ubiquinol oxidase subunit II [Synechococcales cyanobacterium CRU_2_2]
MGLSHPAALDKLQADLTHLVARLPELEHGLLIQRALQNILLMAEENLERLDWKILQGSLQDMEHAFRVFAPYRHVRKVAVFGSARTPETDPDYSIAFAFSKCMAAQGFVIMTGAG